MADVPSRLSSGNIYYKGGFIPIDEYRNMIFARNLYNLNDEYENTQLFSSNGESKVAESISTILTVIPQYNRVQVNTNLLGNVYDAFRDDGSPLARIGLVMLGKQMAFNSAMNLSVKYIPTIDGSQLLKGNPEKIFALNKDNTITVKNAEDKTFLDKVGSTASNVLGIDTYDVFGDANPFDKTVTNIDYIRNTGEQQLKRFFNAVNLNPYKPINPEREPDYTSVVREYSQEVGAPLLSSIDTLQAANRVFFNFSDYKKHPYFRRPLSIAAEQASVIANQNMILSYSIEGGTVQEYAPYIQFVQDNFGYTQKPDDVTIIEDGVGEKSVFTRENKNDKLVWGRDGLAPEATAFIKDLRGDADAMNLEPDSLITTSTRTGLLEYTRNLLNATEGNFVDITRKAFKDGEKYVGFQGSPLWKGTNTKYSTESGNAEKSGVRQHTILDPYGNDETELLGTKGFAKSIRFKGNIVYNSNNNGNQNSVIYKTVLPRIHPTVNRDGKIDNKNLMFSLENLAVGTVEREKFGVIDDEYGTPIPLSEVGKFGGRLMWFPPYNIEINEVAIAKYESTVMVGRNEPMYNYMNSERTAVLSFSLLVDYPEQLRNLDYKGEDKNKAIAEFFAFGGNPLPSEYEIEIIEKKIEDLKQQLEEIGGPVDQAEPPEVSVPDVTIYFQNDTPVSGAENTIINTMYNNPEHYEIIEGLESSTDGNGFGYNKDIYFRTGLTGSIESGWTLTSTVDQYTSIGTQDQFGPSVLNKNLMDVFGDAEFRKYYNVNITGTASKLYLSENEQAYNQALGNRRVEAAAHLVYSRLKEMFGAEVANELRQSNFVRILNIGSTDGSAAGADPNNMHDPAVKKERSATINIARNSVPVDNKVQELNTQQQQDKEKILADIQNLELQLAALRNNLKENVYKERNKAILNSFESISGNQFYPVFHSQTPEDFHRRLTFLQQCTRQGAAKRYDIVDENTGELRARNSVFGKQPICVLRIGDFFHTKVVIENVTIDYADTTWDMNPEGFGMQPMMANITLQMKIIGGQSLQGPIDALQNAVTFNYYGNSNFTDRGIYARPSIEAAKQEQYIKGVVGEKRDALNAAYDALVKVREGEQ